MADEEANKFIGRQSTFVWMSTRFRHSYRLPGGARRHRRVLPGEADATLDALLNEFAKEPLDRRVIKFIDERRFPAQSPRKFALVGNVPTNPPTASS